MSMYTDSPESRLNSEDNILYKKIHDNRQNKNWKPVPVPDFLKPLIGTAVELESNKEVAKNFGVCPATVTAIGRGFNTLDEMQRGENPDAALMRKTDDAKAQIKDTALDRLAKSLGFITDDKLEDEKPLSLSQIARNMATITEKLDPRAGDVNIGNVVIYAPQQRGLDKFQTIDVEPRIVE